MESTTDDRWAVNEHVRALQDQIGRASEEPPGALRDLRIHCLREKAVALLEAIDSGFQARHGSAICSLAQEPAAPGVGE